jgi:hypothetical protein
MCSRQCNPIMAKYSCRTTVYLNDLMLSTDPLLSYLLVIGWRTTAFFSGNYKMPPPFSSPSSVLFSAVRKTIVCVCVCVLIFLIYFSTRIDLLQAVPQERKFPYCDCIGALQGSTRSCWQAEWTITCNGKSPNGNLSREVVFQQASHRLLPSANTHPRQQWKGFLPPAQNHPFHSNH